MIGRRYEQGFKDGNLQALQQFERVLSVLREEMADLRRDRDAQLARADACVDLLLQHLGTRAITLAGQQAEDNAIERRVRSVEALTKIPDIDAELPIGDPRGRYTSIEEAKLDYEGLSSNG